MTMLEWNDLMTQISNDGQFHSYTYSVNNNMIVNAFVDGALIVRDGVKI